MGRALDGVTGALAGRLMALWRSAPLGAVRMLTPRETTRSPAEGGRPGGASRRVLTQGDQRRGDRRDLAKILPLVQPDQCQTSWLRWCNTAKGRRGAQRRVDQPTTCNVREWGARLKAEGKPHEATPN